MDNHSSGTIHHSSYQPGGSAPEGWAPGPTPYPYPAPQPWGSGAPRAGLGGRILAYLIDYFIVGIVVGAGYTLMAVIAIAGAATQTDEGATLGGLGAMLIALVLIPVALVIQLFNEVYLAGKNNGQTIGKKLMKIRVAKEDGTPFGYMDAFLRNVIGYWISGLICGLGFIWGLFDSRNQAWHDKIFHTIVVQA